MWQLLADTEQSADNWARQVSLADHIWVSSTYSEIFGEFFAAVRNDRLLSRQCPRLIGNLSRLRTVAA